MTVVRLFGAMSTIAFTFLTLLVDLVTRADAGRIVDSAVEVSRPQCAALKFQVHPQRAPPKRCVVGPECLNHRGVIPTGAVDSQALRPPRMGRRAYKVRMIRVFLLDDHEVVRRGIAELLTQDGDIEIVGESASAVEAVARIPALHPDVAILDARLPDGNGIDVCRDVRTIDPNIHGLILTSYDDDEALFAAIMAGAAGYVLKQIRGFDLVDVVRRVAAGQSMLDPAVTARVMERIRTGVEAPDEFRSLTDQERRILEFVTLGMTNHEIALEMSLADKTVKNYVSSVLTKLGLERRTQAAVLATKLLRPNTD